MITNRRDFNVWRTQYERIKADFCINCKYRKQAEQGCSHFFFGNAVCLNFKWVNQVEKKKYEEQVLNNQATTIWLEKNKAPEEVYKMSQKELRSVLTKKHYEQFAKEEQEAQELLDKLLSEESATAINLDRSKEPTPTVKKGVKKPSAQFINQGLLKKRPQSGSKLAEMIEQVRQRVDDVAIQTTEPAEPTIHYFYCNKEGKEVIYKRGIQAKGYEREVITFRKYLAKQGIKIIKEERK